MSGWGGGIAGSASWMVRAVTRPQPAVSVPYARASASSSARSRPGASSPSTEVATSEEPAGCVAGHDVAQDAAVEEAQP